MTLAERLEFGSRAPNDGHDGAHDGADGMMKLSGEHERPGSALGQANEPDEPLAGPRRSTLGQRRQIINNNDLFARRRIDRPLASSIHLSGGGGVKWPRPECESLLSLRASLALNKCLLIGRRCRLKCRRRMALRNAARADRHPLAADNRCLHISSAC